MSVLRHIRQDTINEWWKEAISDVWEYAEREQWRRIWWMIQVVEGQECGCGSDRDWICPRCWVLANARHALGGAYFRDEDVAAGFSHGWPTRDPVPAR